MKHLISPNYTHEKLEPPLFKDVVDVFEDRMRHWLLEPAKSLLKIKHGSVPAIALAINYIEGIEIYESGCDSKDKSREFFVRGYKRIFSPVSGETYMQDSIAKALYKLLRCGFAHDAMFRSGIYFNLEIEEAMIITWPKKNGEFDPNGKFESAIINPKRFIECIEIHFNNYMKSLRSKKSNDTQEKFKKAVELKWAIGKPSPFVGMTEGEMAAKIKKRPSTL
jgi:hypothetical protein